MTQSVLAATHPGKAANIALWVVQILLALAFLGAASGKLLGTPDKDRLPSANSFAPPASRPYSLTFDERPIIWWLPCRFLRPEPLT